MFSLGTNGNELSATEQKISSNKLMSWERFKKYYLNREDLGFALDVSKVNFDDAYISSMQGKMKEALAAMEALEAGAIANPDENRMVGHYWLRKPELAPTPELTKEISDNVEKIKAFARPDANRVIYEEIKSIMENKKTK